MGRRFITLIASGGGPVDTTAPTCVLTSSALDLVTGAFTVTATLSEESSDFDADSLTLVNCTAGVAGTGPYTLTITPTADGTASVQVGAGGFHDAAGNANEASNTISRIYLSTLAEWMRSDMGLYKDAAKSVPATADDDLVYTWDNLITGNDFVQATEGARPKLKIIGGIPFVRTDGADDILSVNISADASQTVIVAVKKVSAIDTTTRRMISFAGSTTACIHCRSGTSTGYNYATNQAAGATVLGGTPTDLNVVSLVLTDTSTASARINGGAAVTFDPSDGYASQTSIQLGQGTFDGDYAEWIRCTSPLSDAAREAVEAYLEERVVNPT